MLRPGGVGGMPTQWKRALMWLPPILLLLLTALSLSFSPRLTSQLQSLLFPLSLTLPSQTPLSPPADPSQSRDPNRKGYMVPITILNENEGPYSDGVCLDGSPPAYHFSPGWGTGRTKWVIHMQSGGWCADVADCQARSATELGSSRKMPPSMPFSGILANASADNPFFFNWNRAYVRYCDGASLAGTRGPLREHGLFLFGQKVFLRVLAHLTAHHGLATASHALLSGHSAGGLAAMLHCDQFADIMHALRGAQIDAQSSLGRQAGASLAPLVASLAAPAPGTSELEPPVPDFFEAVDTDARGVPKPDWEARGGVGGEEGGGGLVVKCLSDAGFFPEEQDVAGGSTIGDMFYGTVTLHRPATVAACEAARSRAEEEDVSLDSGNNSSRNGVGTSSTPSQQEEDASLDANSNSNSDSVGSTSTPSRHRLNDTFCFFPRNFLPYIRTPVFVLNSLYDSWMIKTCLIPEASADASWRACRDRTSDCSTAQLEVLRQYGASLVEKVREGLYGTPRELTDPRGLTAGTPGSTAGARGRVGKSSGACLFSCNFHSAGLWTSRWHGPRIQGLTFAEIVGSWFEGEKEENFYVDCQEHLPPCNPSCS